jgi:hypothetical protein
MQPSRIAEGVLVDHAWSGHVGAATAPSEEGQPDRDFRVGDKDKEK